MIRLKLSKRQVIVTGGNTEYKMVSALVPLSAFPGYKRYKFNDLEADGGEEEIIEAINSAKGKG